MANDPGLMGNVYFVGTAINMREEQHQLSPDVIAIDGPAASGKTTVGLMLADALDYLFLDTGLMYRALTLAAIERGIAPGDQAALTKLAKEIDLDVLPRSGEPDGRHYTVMLDGRDVTWDLRAPEVDAAVSQVSSFPGVRAEMVRRQRAFCARGRIVMVGRDIGTVVVPHASVKLYITASPEERARRRLADRSRQGQSDDFQVILADIIRRDEIDSTREHSPLRPAADARIIDTTNKTADQVLQDILAGLKPTNEQI